MKQFITLLQQLSADWAQAACEESLPLSEYDQGMQDAEELCAQELDKLIAAANSETGESLDQQAPNAMLPCPWCGEHLSTEPTVSEGSTFRWRKVNGCCADGPEIRHDTMADNQEAAEIQSHADAIAAWNTQASVKPGWNTSPPNKEGWYWYDDGKDINIHQVFQRPGHAYLCVEGEPYGPQQKRDFKPVDRMNGMWSHEVVQPRRAAT